MATVSDSSSSLDGYNSPRPPRRSLSSRNPSSSSPSSPWSQVVRSSSDSEAIASAIPFSPQELDQDKVDCSSSEAATVNCDGRGNAGGRMKQAWNKPSNGVIEVGNVMGSSWPALSESSKVSPKSSSDSLKALAEGSASVSQGPVTPSSPQKSNSNNMNPNLSPNHSFPARQKPNKRGGGGGGGPNNNGGFQSLPSPETAQNASDRVANAGGDLSPRAIAQKNNNWEIGSRGSFVLQQPHTGNDQQRNSFRRGNGGGPHPRGAGDGPYHNSYGSRRDQDRQNYEWNPHQHFSGRDIHMRQQRGGPRGFVRQPPPTPPPFITPLPVRAYAAPMGFSDMRSPIYYVPTPSPESLGMVSYVAPAAPHGMFIPAPDPQLRSMLVKQIDYYFSSENLCKDIFLRQNMDEQGWVPISLIATFNRVKQLTMYFPFILEAVRSSTIVEVQGDKMRKRNDWMNWVLPPPNRFSAVSPGPQSPNYDALATRIQNFGLEGTVNHNTTRGQVDSHAEGVLTRSSSWQPNRQLPATILTVITNGEEMGQSSIHMGSDQSMAVRRLEE